MRADNRLPRVLHALLHMAEMKGPATSSQLAKMLGTNPSVVRRTMSGLRDVGLLVSVKGHGGGWSLKKPLEEISLIEVYEALGQPQLFAIGLSQSGSGCLMEKAADQFTASALEKASSAFQAELREVKVSEIADQFKSQMESGAGRKQHQI